LARSNYSFEKRQKEILKKKKKEAKRLRKLDKKKDHIEDTDSLPPQ
jgi:hypothetical protein